MGDIFVQRWRVDFGATFERSPVQLYTDGRASDDEVGWGEVGRAGAECAHNAGRARRQRRL